MEVTAVFVYGTLKRGQCRAPLWPIPPQRVEVARARGALYRLETYPALLPGPDIVLGELWHFATEEMPRTLEVLDEVEHYVDGGDDLYTRQMVLCQGEESGAVKAWCYFFAQPERILHYPRVVADKNGACWLP